MRVALQSPNGFFERDQLIIKYCSDRTVLHLGCVGETDASVDEKVQNRERLLHFKVDKVARDLYGVDLDHIALQRYQKEFNVENLYTGNVEQLEKIDIRMTFKAFDVILFADLMEHVSNPGLVLEGMKHFINERSLVLISVPHAFGILNFIRYSLGNFQEGQEHVAMYNIAGLSNLLARHGYSICNYTCYERRLITKTQKMIFYFPYIFLKLFPKFGGTILIIAQLYIP